MNLMKLFNFNYLKQNLKKSRAILIFFIGVIPIMSSITFLVRASNINGSGYVSSLEELSIINFIGIYILPFVISFCLFGFVFKRKSVDFINSMPISRKSIFITNSLGGIGILILMNLISVILLVILNMIFSNIFIPWELFWDYFIVWSIIYVFVFTACNLAMSISGNFITEIVVTALILFLVPFTHQLITSYNFSNSYSRNVNITCTEEECTPINYNCNLSDISCEINKNLGIYSAVAINNNSYVYTAPYNFFYQVLFNSSNKLLYNGGQLAKMLILSIVYFFLGLYLFRIRKMEVCETSFKSNKEHNLVKGLTLIPIWTFSYLIIKNVDDLFVSILILSMIIVYYFIYDLITKKGITNIKNIILSFIVASFIIVVILEINDNRSEKTLSLNVKDIKEAYIDILEDNNINDDSKEVYIENKELINLLVKSNLNNSSSNIYSSSYYYDDYYIYYAKFKTKNNKVYTFKVYLNQNDYNKVLEIVSSNEEYTKEFKNINYGSLFALEIGNDVIDIDNNKEIITIIKDTLKDISIQEYIELDKTNSQNSIKLYSYNNHKIITYKINKEINTSLKEKVINYYNNKLNSDLKKIGNIFYLSCDKDFCNNYSYDYDNADILKFIVDNINDSVDTTSDYVTISFYTSDNNYYFTTNRVEEFSNLIKCISTVNTEDDSGYGDYE